MLKLIDLLYEKDKKLFAKFNNNINKLVKYLEGTTLPFFTHHGTEHSESLIDNFDKLIPTNIKKEMNEVEIFILLSSAYFHDIGMGVKLDEDDSQKDDQSKQEYDKRLDFIRRTHADRAYKFIMKDDVKDKFDLDKGTASVLAEICHAHKDNIYIEGDEKFKKDWDPCLLENNGRERTFQKILKKTSIKAVNKYNVRVHFLAATLRLGDELDINYNRAYDKLDDKRDMSYMSKFEHKKNKLISGIHINSEKFEIIADVFEEELYEACGDRTADNNKALTEVIIKLRETLLEVKKTLIDNGLNYDQIRFQDQVIINLHRMLFEDFGIEKDSQPIYADPKYGGAMLWRFFYELETLDLSPEYIISNDIDFLFSDSDNFIENFDSIFLKYKYNKDQKETSDINALKIDILKHLSQISCFSITDNEISDINNFSANYIKIIEKIPEKTLETDDGFIKKNIEKLIESWNQGNLANEYYLPAIQKETLSFIVRDKYSSLRKENFKRKCQNHFIYIIFSETYFLKLLEKRRRDKSIREIFECKLNEMNDFITNEKYKNIKFYYYSNPLDAEGKLISSEIAYENSFTNDSIMVINNINITIDYYKKILNFLESMCTWKIKSIFPNKLLFEFDTEDKFYKKHAKYKKAFLKNAESSILGIIEKFMGGLE